MGRHRQCQKALRIAHCCMVHAQQRDACAHGRSAGSGKALTCAGMQERLEQVQAEFTTALEDDEALLEAADAQMSDWDRVALTYRIERQKLAKAMDTILQLYTRLAKEGQK